MNEETVAVTAAPLVSIIVPSYNQGAYIRETLESIFSQDYRPLEVLVMDGGSKDETVAVLQRYAARYPELHWRSEPDAGVADAVNKGLALAKGVYAGIQSSDDVYRPGAVAEAVAILQSDSGFGVVCGDVDIIDESGKFLKRVPNRLPFTPQRFLSRSLIIHQSSAFFRLELARAVGGWRPQYFCCDTEMWLRLLFRTRIHAVDRIWSGWRIQPGQRNRESKKMWESWGRMFAESPELRRAPLSWRLAAKAGRRLVAQHYNPVPSRWFCVVQAWCAIAIYPPSWEGVRPLTVLFPGARRLQSWLRRQFSGEAA